MAVKNKSYPKKLTPLDYNGLNRESLSPNSPWFENFSYLWLKAFESSSDMISVIDNNHRIVAVNSAMAKAMGCDPEDAVGKQCFQMVHGTEEPHIGCPYHKILEGHNEHQSEIYEKLLNLWLQVRVIPLRDENQELLGCIHMTRDITQQKKAEQARRESEERYHHLSEATMEGVLLSDGTKIIASNQVLADMLGHSVEALIGVNILQFIPPHHQKKVIDLLRNKMVGIHYFECKRKNGSFFPVEAHSRILTFNGKDVFQAAIRDLTEEKRIEKERAQHNRLQGVLEMAGAVCHEINQPLMALQGFLELLALKIDMTEDISKDMTKLTEQISRMKKLTHKLMNITKYETKEYATGKKIIDIDQAAHKDITS